MTQFFLGVDVGGTKTHAVLANETGQILAFHTDEAGNPEVTGFSHLATLNQRVVHAICDQAGIELHHISGAAFGIAGFDWRSQTAQFQDVVRMDGLTDNVMVTNDTILGLTAGATAGWGICLVAGTSFNCRGRTLDGREGRVIGDGLRWGEGAGALELATYAVEAICAAWARRGEPTSLTQALLQYYGYTSIDMLIEDLVLFRKKIEPDFALRVFEMAHDGDLVANKCVIRAAESLGSLAFGVIRQLSLERENFEVVLTGSMFKAGAILIDPLKTYISKHAPGATLVHLEAPPVAGAVMLAIQQQRAIHTHKFRATLLANLADYYPATSIVTGGGTSA
ncbi:MAG: BadF/BadG/BcrA/BcrD ATPase family protein [Aggregatilineales bacterium]